MHLPPISRDYGMATCTSYLRHAGQRYFVKHCVWSCDQQSNTVGYSAASDPPFDSASAAQLPTGRTNNLELSTAGTIVSTPEAATLRLATSPPLVYYCYLLNNTIDEYTALRAAIYPAHVSPQKSIRLAPGGRACPGTRLDEGARSSFALRREEENVIYL